MTRTFALSLLLAFACFGLRAIAQKPFDPDSILVGNDPQPSVLLVGSFHFAYYNLDAHKVDSSQQIDILSPPRQREMEELVDYIARFKPNKIAIEAWPNTGYLLRNYEKYLAGSRPLKRDEIEQIGFRLMRRFGLDTIYGVNESPLIYDLYDGADSLSFRPVLDTIYQDWDFRSESELSKRYTKLYDYEDQRELQISLLENFLSRNSDHVSQRGFGAYLVGDFELGDTRGADALSMHWYNRNLRIFRRIQQITRSPQDRILVLFGSGHTDILRQLFECTPQYKLVKFGELR